MKRGCLLLVPLILFATPLHAQVIISQYYEAYSYNKWIELTNVGSDTVDLASPQIYVCWYLNSAADHPGGTVPDLAIPLSDTLKPGNTFLLSDSAATLPSYAWPDIANSSILHSGDDIIFLSSANGSDAWANRTDCVGDGTEWGENCSFIRNYDIITPNLNWTPAEWTEATLSQVDGADENTSVYLGYHIYQGGMPGGYKFVSLSFIHGGIAVNDLKALLNLDAVADTGYDPGLDIPHEASPRDSILRATFDTTDPSFAAAGIQGLNTSARLDRDLSNQLICFPMTFTGTYGRIYIHFSIGDLLNYPVVFTAGRYFYQITNVGNSVNMLLVDTLHCALYLGDTTPPEAELVDVPTGTLQMGSQVLVSWNAHDTAIGGFPNELYTNLLYSRANNMGFTYIPARYPVDEHSCYWPVPLEFTTSARLKLLVYDICGNRTELVTEPFAIDASGDHDPPVVGHFITQPEAGETVSMGSRLHLAWMRASDNLYVRKLVLELSVDESHYITLVDSLAGTTAFWDVPLPLVTGTPSRIRLIAFDPALNSDTVTTHPFSLVSRYTAQNVLSQISLPLADPEMTVASLFADDLPESQFGVYAWDGSSYILLDADAPLTQGKGYWLVLNTGSGTVQMTGTASDTLVQDLTEGWNCISTLARSADPVNEVEFSVNGGPWMNRIDAIASGVVMAGVFHYDASSGCYQDADDDPLTAWRGYWLHINQPDVRLRLTPTGAYLPGGALPTVAKDSVEELRDLNRWSASLHLAGYQVQDDLATVGVRNHGTSGYDSEFDKPLPPSNPLFTGVRVWFRHPEWQGPVDDYCSDIRGPFDASARKSWTFTIRAEEAGTLSLSFVDVVAALPSGSYVQCTLRGVTYDLLDDPVITFNQTGEDVEATLMIDASDVRVEEGPGDTLPREFGIASIFPNPFNASTSLEVALPHSGHLEVALYNRLGQRISTLASRPAQAGRVRLSVDGRSLASGVYFVRATLNGGETSTGKITLLK